MNEGGVDARVPALLSTAQWLDETASDFGDEVYALLSEVRALVGAGWQGDAAGSHHSAWTEWEEGARRVVAALATDAELLRKAAGRYHRTDENTSVVLRQTGSGWL